MHADRYHRPGLQPGSLAVSLGITGAMIAGLVFSAPNVIAIVHKHDLQITDVTLPPVPPPDPKPVPTRPQPTQRTVITAPQPVVPTTVDLLPVSPPQPLPPDPIGTLPLAPASPVADPPAPPPVLPALVGASVDPRYLDALQPPYPPAETRAGHVGNVVVRVLIGVDGRVKQVERVSAASDDFYAVTERQALGHWRFKPATRGGVPVESWKTMTVHFVLHDA